jgi:phosphoribosyl 1,2-cyclic phosphodiesterase
MFTWRQHVTACKLAEIYQYFGETYGPMEQESLFQTLVDFHSTNDHIPEDRLFSCKYWTYYHHHYPRDGYTLMWYTRINAYVG